MKKLNNFIKDIGVDKVLHFAFGGWAVSVASPFGVLAMAIMFAIIMILSIVKEKYLDEEFDSGDINAAFLGCFTAFMAYIPAAITVARYLSKT